ncbi:MAG: DUF3887 domain-containing protein [Gammaproteobacteria bacterium]
MRINKIDLTFLLLISTFAGSVTVLAAGSTSVTGTDVTKAEAFVHMLAKGDYTTAEAEFTDQMKQGLPADKLKTVWVQLLTQVGVYTGTGETETATIRGDTVVLVKTKFKEVALWAQIAFDKSGKIAGLYFRPTS